MPRPSSFDFKACRIKLEGLGTRQRAGRVQIPPRTCEKSDDSVMRTNVSRRIFKRNPAGYETIGKRALLLALARRDSLETKFHGARWY